MHNSAAALAPIRDMHNSAAALAPIVAKQEREPLIGLAALMTMAFRGIDLTPLGQRLIERADADPEDANALMDLSIVLQLKQTPDIGIAVQAQALQVQQLYHLPARGGAAAIRLLAIMAPGDLMANTPLEFLLQDSDVALDMLYVVPGMPIPPLPEHDLIIVAACESDSNQALLQGLALRERSWHCPVLNLPARIARTGREAAHALLESAPGVCIPVSVRISRQALRRVCSRKLALADVLQDGSFPIIIRPVDSHAGHGLMKIDAPEDLDAYLQAMPEAEFVISHFVDYRSEDGLYRKYRVVLIDGKPYAGHMGISTQWMIHYLNAGMSESADKRAEEAQFMAGFDAGFARRHADALRAIAARLELDYVVIDCGETRDGALLVFEVDTGAVVHSMDPVDLFPYKRAQMQRVFAAFRGLLSRALQGGRKFEHDLQASGAPACARKFDVVADALAPNA